MEFLERGAFGVVYFHPMAQTLPGYTFGPACPSILPTSYGLLLAQGLVKFFSKAAFHLGVAVKMSDLFLACAMCLALVQGIFLPCQMKQDRDHCRFYVRRARLNVTGSDEIL